MTNRNITLITIKFISWSLTQCYFLNSYWICTLPSYWEQLLYTWNNETLSHITDFLAKCSYNLNIFCLHTHAMLCLQSFCKTTNLFWTNLILWSCDYHWMSMRQETAVFEFLWLGLSERDIEGLKVMSECNCNTRNVEWAISSWIFTACCIIH